MIQITNDDNEKNVIAKFESYEELQTFLVAIFDKFKYFDLIDYEGETSTKGKMRVALTDLNSKLTIKEDE